MEQTCLFGPRFLEKYVGKNILYDPKVAIVELIANAWDAGASEVRIDWPTTENEKLFSIADDGNGLTDSEFLLRWRTLSYDRIASQGDTVLVNEKARSVFGQNGIGRFAGFCFGDSYFVESKKGRNKFCYEVKIGAGEIPFTLEKQKVAPKRDEGTRVFVSSQSNIRVSEDEILAEIGMRFLTDPMFRCYVNNREVTFSHIPDTYISNDVVTLDSGYEIGITIIDTQESDKTTKQHGVAWHVNGRLVG